ncbi:ABC transporter permease [Thermogladius sp. KZ2Tp1]|uniref:ABC transporter permease n=1 Tax=Thermogladius sp. KZ2Tp1 TaxID=3136289 RepID=UPI003DA8900F
MYRDLSPLVAMVYRQVKRWMGARSRLVSTVLNPLVWIIFLGLGWGSVFSGTSFSGLPTGVPVPPGLSISDMIQRYFNAIFGGVDYLTFMVSGMASMTVFMGSFIGGLSVIWDKQFGYLKETLVAPASRKLVIAGRILGDAIITTLQGLIVVLLGLALTGGLRLVGIPIAIVYLFISALAFSSLGVIIALKLTSVEGFQMLINLLTMPLMFMSGVFYPFTTMPDWMKVFAQFNPLSYTVHSVRYWLTGADVGLYPMSPVNDLIVLAVVGSAMLWLAGVIFEKTSIEE